MSAKIKQLSATGDVTTESSYLKAVVLTGGSAASSVDVKSGGSGGTTVLTVDAAIDTTVPVDCHDAFLADGIHATLSGTGALVTFVYA